MYLSDVCDHGIWSISFIKVYKLNRLYLKAKHTTCIFCLWYVHIAQRNTQGKCHISTVHGERLLCAVVALFACIFESVEFFFCLCGTCSGATRLDALFIVGQISIAIFLHLIMFYLFTLSTLWPTQQKSSVFDKYVQKGRNTRRFMLTMLFWWCNILLECQVSGFLQSLVQKLVHFKSKTSQVAPCVLHCMQHTNKPYHRTLW